MLIRLVGAGAVALGASLAVSCAPEDAGTTGATLSEMSPEGAPALAALENENATSPDNSDLRGRSEEPVLVDEGESGLQPAKDLPGPGDVFGIGALVNVDVWHRCSGSPPANGFVFTLNTLPNGDDMSSAAMYSYYQNPWITSGTIVDDNPVLQTKTLTWLDATAMGAVPYGEKSHFGYELVDDPDHMVTAQWLFGAGTPQPAPRCSETAISTDWEDVSIDVGRLNAHVEPESRFVTVAQHSDATPMRLNLSYVVTSTQVTLPSLNERWPGLAAAVPAATDALMPISQGLRIEIPVEDTDSWIVLIGEWREGRAARGSARQSRPAQPRVVTYFAIPLLEPIVPGPTTQPPTTSPPTPSDSSTR